MKTVTSILILTVFLLAGCQNSYCPADSAQAALDEIQILAERWDDAMAVAQSTSRMALAGPISDLQAIKRDTGALGVPECLEPAKTTLVKSMDYGIDGMISFMGQDYDSIIEFKFDLYDRNLNQFIREVADIRSCLPKCKAP